MNERDEERERERIEREEERKRARAEREVERVQRKIDRAEEKIRRAEDKIKRKKGLIVTIGEQVDARIDALESKLAAARQQWVRCEEILDAIPGCRPDGTGTMSAAEWVRWAKRQLGYQVGDR